MDYSVKLASVDCLIMIGRDNIPYSIYPDSLKSCLKNGDEQTKDKVVHLTLCGNSGCYILRSQVFRGERPKQLSFVDASGTTFTWENGSLSESIETVFRRHDAAAHSHHSLVVNALEIESSDFPNSNELSQLDYEGGLKEEILNLKVDKMKAEYPDTPEVAAIIAAYDRASRRNIQLSSENRQKIRRSSGKPLGRSRRRSPFRRLFWFLFW
jgi:hypothetical protein